MTSDHSHAAAGSHCDGHSHCHAHGIAPADFDRAMFVGVGLNAAFVIVEIACGVLAGSLALVADAGHNAGDVVGLLLAWGASHLARRPPTQRYTWGYRRSTIYAALGIPAETAFPGPDGRPIPVVEPGTLPIPV